MDKKCNIVMLPTEKVSGGKELILENLQFEESILSYKCVPWIANTDSRQHLYVLSDELVEAGDWFYTDSLKSGKIWKAWKADGHSVDININTALASKVCKKIIATTDTSLMINGEEETTASASGFSTKFNKLITLPNLTEDFINVYVDVFNEGYEITEVLVEYEHGVKTNGLQELIDSNPEYYTKFPEELPNYVPEVKTKISKENSIIIKPIPKKDSWSKSEVEELMLQAFWNGVDVEANGKDFNVGEWIKEKLQKYNQ